MARTIPTVARELCLSFPRAEEVVSHGSPDFKVGGKSFAMLCINHHGDGRVALWLRSPEGVQRLYTEARSEAYFIPPYVGPRGWLGVELNKGLDWREIANRVREAYVNAAPSRLAEQLGEVCRIEPPDQDMPPEEIDPILGEYPREILGRLAELCRRLPETSPSERFGNPVWLAGKKTFVCVFHSEGRLKLQFWVGVDQQAFLIADNRYSISMYLGQNGWIDLDVQKQIDWGEVDSLLRNSYRHFALKRMLRALDG